MCNAWNHPPGCTCGWGGDGHLGGEGGWAGGYGAVVGPFCYQEGPLSNYRYEKSDFCHPTHCPECGREVYLIRHNGGSVWVDPPLGWPWPKHEHGNDGGSPAYKFIADFRVRYKEIEIKPKLARVVKRIFRNFDHVYLIETHEGRICALSASRFERTTFTDLVAVRYTEDKIFLEDSRGIPVRVRNFKLTPETMESYLNTPGEILYVSKPKPARQPPILLVCGYCRQKIRKTRFPKHLRKVHGIIPSSN